MTTWVVNDLWLGQKLQIWFVPNEFLMDNVRGHSLGEGEGVDEKDDNNWHGERGVIKNAMKTLQKSDKALHGGEG